MAQRQETGRRGEDLAAGFVESLGWTVRERNWRCRYGEIDLVAAEPDGTLVFCEVKCRRGLGYGNPLEAITWAKVRRLRQLAAHWLATHEHRGRVRLDAVGIVDLPGREPEFRHVKGIGQ